MGRESTQSSFGIRSVNVSLANSLADIIIAMLFLQLAVLMAVAIATVITVGGSPVITADPSTTDTPDIKKAQAQAQVWQRTTPHTPDMDTANEPEVPIGVTDTPATDTVNSTSVAAEEPCIYVPYDEDDDHSEYGRRRRQANTSAVVALKEEEEEENLPPCIFTEAEMHAFDHEEYGKRK